MPFFSHTDAHIWQVVVEHLVHSKNFALGSQPLAKRFACAGSVTGGTGDLRAHKMNDTEPFSISRVPPTGTAGMRLILVVGYIAKSS